MSKEQEATEANKPQWQPTKDVRSEDAKTRGTLHRRIMQGPLQDLLTEMLDQVEVVLPHKKGAPETLENEMRFETIKRALLNKFHKNCAPRLSSLLSEFVVLERVKTSKHIIRFDKPTRAVGEKTGEDTPNGTEAGSQNG